MFSINDKIDRGLQISRANPQLAYVAPTYGQAERIAWDMLKQYSQMIPGIEFNQQKLTATIPRKWLGDRVKIMLLGAENYDSIRGVYLDWGTLDEYGTMSPEVFTKVIRPALSDRDGGATFVGTVNGMNHFHDVYRMALENRTGDWYAQVFKASETGIIPQRELEALRLEMSEEAYLQEFECDWGAALVGAYFGREMSRADAEGRITDLPHDPALPVFTYWDLGIDDTTAIWFVQHSPQGFRVIDYLEMSGQGVDYYVREIKKGHRSDYVYERHHWPHDGDSRDFSTGMERSKVARDLGLKPLEVHARSGVADGIEAARMVLRRCWFDRTRCARGIDALRNYQRKYDAKNRIYQDTPLHDWSSHGADGFRLFAMASRRDTARVLPGRELPRRAVTEYDIFKR